MVGSLARAISITHWGNELPEPKIASRHVRMPILRARKSFPGAMIALAH
jgi:hypothetical protein